MVLGNQNMPTRTKPLPRPVMPISGPRSDAGPDLSRDRGRTDQSQDPGASRWRVECNVGDARDEKAGHQQVKEGADAD